MAGTMRIELGWVFAGWAVTASFLWLATPWMSQWSAWMGPAWVWCAALPAGAMVLLFPRHALALVAGLSGGVIGGLVAGLGVGLRLMLRALKTGERAFR